MGLFDELAGGLAGRLFSGGDKNKLFESITALINDPQTGGLFGLAKTFKDKGLGDAISSWISTGNNLPVSADQIMRVLGADQIQEISKNVGVTQVIKRQKGMKKKIVGGRTLRNSCLIALKIFS